MTASLLTEKLSETQSSHPASVVLHDTPTTDKAVSNCEKELRQGAAIGLAVGLTGSYALNTLLHSKVPFYRLNVAHQPRLIIWGAAAMLSGWFGGTSARSACQTRFRRVLDKREMRVSQISAQQNHPVQSSIIPGLAQQGSGVAS